MATMADNRRRPRRVQRKIDKRMGLAHYDEGAQIVLALGSCSRSAAEVARRLGTISAAMRSMGLLALDDIGRPLRGLGADLERMRRLAYHVRIDADTIKAHAPPPSDDPHRGPGIVVTCDLVPS